MVRKGGTIRLPWFAIVVALCAAVSTAVADDIDDKAVAKAKKTLHDNQEHITFFAHPTARLNKMEYLSIKKGDAGFKLTYRLDYTSAANRLFYSKLAFEFDVDGNYKTVTEIATSALVESFAASDLVVKYVKDKLLDKLGLQKDKALADLLDKGDVKAILRVIIKSGSGP